MTDENLPTITESDWNSQYGGEDANLPVMPESEYQMKFGSVGNAALSGAVNLPGDTIDLVSSIPQGVENVYETVTNPLDAVDSGAAEKVARFAGNTGAMVLGGLAGAPLAPFTFGASVPIGATIGNWLYNKTQQVVGNDEPTTLKEDVNRAAYGGVQNLILGGLTKGAKTTGRLIKDRGTAIESQVLGYNPKLKGRRVAGLDAEGEVVPTGERGVKGATKQDLKLKDLQNSDFPSQIKFNDNPASVAEKLWEFKEIKGKELGKLVDDAADLEKQFVKDGSLAPSEKGHYFQKSDPDWSSVEEFVAQQKDFDIEIGGKLEKQLAVVKETWNNSDQTVDALKGMKRSHGVKNEKTFKFDKSNTDTAFDSFNNQVYGTMAESIKDKISFLGQYAEQPELINVYNKINKDYSAAATFHPKAFDAARKGVGGRFAKEFLSPAGLAKNVIAGGATPFLGPIALVGRAGAALKSLAPVQISKLYKGSGGLLDIGSPKLAGAAAIGIAKGGEPNSGDESSPLSQMLLPEAEAASFTDAQIAEMNKPLNGITGARMGAILPDEPPLEEGGFSVTQYDDALKQTLGFEGGLSNHPDDTGGPTNFGITQKTYDSWRKENKFPSRSVAKINEDEVKDIYKTKYWDVSGSENLPPALAKIHFDTAVHFGPQSAIKFLQKLLGVETDGRMGEETLAALENIEEKKLIYSYLNLRENRYKQIAKNDPSQSKFLTGWLNRNNKLKSLYEGTFA